MTRMSKVGEIRNVCPKRPRVKGKKSGPKKDNLSLGYKAQVNALNGLDKRFIAKVK